MRIAKKIIFVTVCLLQLMFVAEAQKPVISNINKSTSTVNEILSITGSGFGTIANNIKVSFGSVNGFVISVTENLIKVKVPAAVIYSSVAVTNITTGLTGYSSQQFGLAFGGDNFSAANLLSQQDFAAGAGLFDLCLCDFDGDGKSDVATSNDVATNVGIFRNTSTATAINFNARQALSLGVAAPTKNIACGDIDGDGKPDLVVSGSGDDYGKTIFIFRNTSPGIGTISFAPAITKVVGANGAARLSIRDLNADGKPELVITNRSVNLVSIFPNTSNLGSISFSALQTVTVTGAAHTNGLATEDLDGDGLPEIVVNTNQQSNVYILKNLSTSSSISFQTSPIVLAAPSGSVNLVVGDLDNDGKPDIAVTNVLYNRVYLFRNKTTTSISYDNIQEISTDTQPWGITLGDADGDGKTDILVGFSQSKFINVLENTSVTGALSFTKHSIATTEKTRNIKFGDLNGDAKPDLVFTSTETSQLSTFRNKHCLEAKISPAGPLAVCSDTEVTLSAPSGFGVSFQWLKDGTALSTETSSSITPTESGVYTVSITSALDGCSKTSTGVSLTIDNASLGTVSVSANTVCVGGTITLTATSGGSKYKWSGPNGFSAETSTNTTTIPNATAANQGQYYLVMEKGTCSSLPIPFTATVNPLPNPIVNAITGTLSFCEGSSVVLSAGAYSSYQWKKNGTNINAATSQNHTASTDGNYSVLVSNANGCTKESAAVTVSANEPPVAAFIAKSTVCVGLEVIFENTSVVTGTATYLWDFGDGETSTQQNPSHVYTAIFNAYNVSLEVSYNEDCKNSTSKPIEVIEAPVLAITAEGSTTFCEGDSVKLSVPTIFKNYVWTTGDDKSITSPSVYAKKTGIVTVAVITEEGCTINASIALNTLSNPEVFAESDKMILKPGESAQLNASGAASYSWLAADGITSLTVNNPVVSPIRTTTYFVTGTNEIGCSGTAEITIEVDNALSVTPKKLFVPEYETYWEIEGIEYYDECSVIIFNKQGLKLFENKDYANNRWDGTFNNQNVPEGVYYFVIRCDGNKNDKTGSITIMR